MSPEVLSRTDQIQLRGDKKDQNKKGKGKGGRKGKRKNKGKGKGSTKASTGKQHEECEGHEEEAQEEDDEVGDDDDKGQEEQDKCANAAGEVEEKVGDDKPGRGKRAAKTSRKNRGTGRKSKRSGKGQAKAKGKKTRGCKKAKNTKVVSPPNGANADGDDMQEMEHEEAVPSTEPTEAPAPATRTRRQPNMDEAG